MCVIILYFNVRTIIMMCTEMNKSRGMQTEADNTYDSNEWKLFAVRGNADDTIHTGFIISMFAVECSMSIIALCMRSDTVQNHP